MSRENSLPSKESLGFRRKRKDSPVEREQAYHAFKTALDTKFSDHPDIVVSYRRSESLELENSDTRVKSMEVVKLTTIPERNAFISGDYLDIKYTDGKRILYMYTPEREVIKWSVKPEEAIPTIPPLPSEDEPVEVKLRLYDELIYRVKERTRYLKEHLANLMFGQRMKLNGQPVSAQEAYSVAIMINNKRGRIPTEV